MKVFLWIALGGAAGAILRYQSVLVIHRQIGFEFPYGTLFVNVLGSLLIGILSIVMIRHWQNNEIYRNFLLIGFLGAFTTFSSFSIETVSLIEQGLLIRASLNVLLSVIVCLAMTSLGIIIGKQL